jgi:hypothetical protein
LLVEITFMQLQGMTAKYRFFTLAAQGSVAEPVGWQPVYSIALRANNITCLFHFFIRTRL